MSAFIVHSIAGSPFGRSVLATLEEKGATYRFVPVPPATLREPAHRARHPFGRIPVLEHGDFMLYETQAILRYLDRVLPDPPLTPHDPKAAGRMDQAINVTDWYVFQGVGNVIGFQRIVGPRLRGLTPDESAIAAVMPQARLVGAEVARMLGSADYFGGDRVSLADLHLAPQLDFLAQTPEWSEVGAPHANLVAWLDRVLNRPSLQATTWDRVAAMATTA